jgi:hypothetical protein
MKITVTSIIRIADSETFAPVETAVVSSAGVRAMHRDGGYYVFVNPFAANSSIDISCDGYAPISIVASEKRTVYLKPLHTAAATTQLYVSEYNADNRSIAIISADGELPFVLEESLSHIFDIIHRNRLKVSLIQSSAVTISVCVDNNRFVKQAIEQLQQAYRVVWNEGLSLLTIRGTTPDILCKEQEGRDILLHQLTRRTAKLVIKD